MDLEDESLGVCIAGLSERGREAVASSVGCATDDMTSCNSQHHDHDSHAWSM